MDYSSFKPWFYAHSLYNLIWGTLVILFPKLYFDLIGLEYPNYLSIWQVVGMFVLVYSPAYYWIAQDPEKHYHLVLIAFLGTLFGPIGFLWGAYTNDLDLAFGWTIITNDLIWLPMFFMYLSKLYRDKGFKALFNA